MHYLAYLKSMKVFFVLFFVASCPFNPFFATADISETFMQDDLMERSLLVEVGIEIESFTLTDVEEFLDQNLMSSLVTPDITPEMNVMDPRDTAQISMEALKQDADASLMASTPQPPLEKGYLATAMNESSHPLILNYLNMPNILIAVMMFIILGAVIRKMSSSKEKYSHLTISPKDFK